MPPPFSHSWSGLLLDGLLSLGVFFPVISVVTLELAWWTRWSTGRHSSAVLIPVIGPILLTLWILISRKSSWWIPLAWIADPATLVFLIVSPRLWKDYWRYSRWTRIVTLRSQRGGHSVVLSLHIGGHYLLEQDWKSQPVGSLNPLHTGEIGRYESRDGRYELISDGGRSRTLQPTTEANFEVVEHTATAMDAECLLDGWILRRGIGTP